MATNDAASPVSSQPGRGSDLIPVADIYETPGGLAIVAEFPGVPRDALDIQVEKGVLKISGTVAPPVAGELRPLHAEFAGGTFVRRFALSEELDSSKVSAEFEDGVLTLTIPRAERAQPRKIPVRRTD